MIEVCTKDKHLSNIIKAHSISIQKTNASLLSILYFTYKVSEDDLIWISIYDFQYITTVTKCAVSWLAFIGCSVRKLGKWHTPLTTNFASRSCNIYLKKGVWQDHMTSKWEPNQKLGIFYLLVNNIRSSINLQPQSLLWFYWLRHFHPWDFLLSKSNTRTSTASSNIYLRIKLQVRDLWLWWFCCPIWLKLWNTKEDDA